MHRSDLQDIVRRTVDHGTSVYGTGSNGNHINIIDRYVHGNSESMSVSLTKELLDLIVGLEGIVQAYQLSVKG